jgi:divalent metal cation (Fe/Co/Zn/Cd) transporter
LPETKAGTPENRRLRLRTARFSLGSAVTLCLLKFAVGIVSGSLGVLASALDNVADIFMSAVNLLSIRKALDPADASVSTRTGMERWKRSPPFSREG